MAKRWGSSVREKTVSLVKKPASSNPKTAGCTAFAPVAMTAFLYFKNFSATAITQCRFAIALFSKKRASPRKTSIPKD